MPLENIPVDLPDFELVANMFVEEGVRVVSPSELHGLISGHLAAGARLKPEALLQTACELLDIESLSQESSKLMIVNLYEATADALASLDLDFEMLLPDDENEISQRADALGRWCQSFLGGFGLYGKHTDASLSTEAKETLNDLGQIAQISIDVDELDENESDLMEVQEYVRMAVLMLFTECNQAVENKEKAFAQVQPENNRLHQMKISLEQFAKRREQLMDKMLPGSIAIIPAAQMKQRNSDVEYPFRQDSHFYYLTGFNEPDAVLLLIPGRAAGESVMFCRGRDKLMEIWNGYRAGPEGVVADYNIAEAHTIDEIDMLLPALLDGISRIYYSIGRDEDLDQQVRHWLNLIRRNVRKGAVAPSELVMIDQLLNEMRLIKTDAEQAVMREAGEISAQGHIKAMQICKPGMMEYQLEAEILHSFAMQGCRQPAYSTIVGGGINACVLHYIENDQVLNDGDLVLIDAGCELDCYAGDITRTFPVNGCFNAEQKALYQLVLDTQKACIDLAKPGTLWDEVHEKSVQILTQGLIDLGLLKGSLEDEIDGGGYRDFYMHRVGHWLGMDVHDVGDYKVDDQWRPLQPGMVMTVEPGIYVAADNEKVEPRWRGIGIRIEDDVLITEQGCEILTASVPKEIDEIEALMASA